MRTVASTLRVWQGATRHQDRHSVIAFNSIPFALPQPLNGSSRTNMAAKAKAITSYFKPATGSPAGTVRRAGSSLSEAARKAIKVGVETAEPSAKKAKLSAAVTNGAPTLAGVDLPRATSREELRKNLEAYPHVLPLLQLELDTLGEDWLIALQDELTKPYFLKLKSFVNEEQKGKKVFPPAEDIYSWSRFCPLKDVRVVVVGQDPYHDVGQAHGLAFSVRRGVKIPPSLRNMYTEMNKEMPGFKIPTHGDLTEWAKHGVLLLNTSLTVRAHQAGSHSGQGWEQFTNAVLKVVTERLASDATTPGANGIVMMAWGAHAAKMIAVLDTKRHLVLKSAHPSPLSAHRGFFGNGHFIKSNEWLVERYGAAGGIDWESLGSD